MSGYKGWWLVVAALVMPGCARLDDYLLGQDNTPLPTPLPVVQNTVRLIEQWSVSLGRMSGATRSGPYFKLKPALHGQVVYVADASGRLMAVNAGTGALLWTKQLPERLVSGPVVHAGLIAVSTHNAGLIVLEEHSGHLLWQARVSSEVLASPLLVDNLLIAKTVDGHLLAFDARSGKKRWDVDHGSPHLILKASSSPYYYDGLLLVGFSDGKLDAIELQSGRVVWQRGIAYASGASDVERLVDIDADPVGDHGVIYIASYQGYLSALNAHDGELIWSKPASTYKNIALDAHSIYMTDDDDTLRAFNRTNGQVRWKQPQLLARHVTAPVIMGSWVLVGDESGLLHVLNSHQGDVLGRVMLQGSIDNEPLVSGQRIYVLTNTGQLYCFTQGK